MEIARNIFVVCLHKKSLYRSRFAEVELIFNSLLDLVYNGHSVVGGPRIRCPFLRRSRRSNCSIYRSVTSDTAEDVSSRTGSGQEGGLGMPPEENWTGRT